MTRISALAFAVLAAAAVVTRAQDAPLRYMPEPNYEKLIHVIAEPMQAKDPFVGLSECGVVDAKTFAPVTAAQAELMLEPCIESLNRRYNTTLTLARLAEAASGGVSTQVEGLAIYVPSGIALTSPVMRDLQHGLDARQHTILGHRVVIRRGQAPSTLKAGQKSALQAAVDGCMQPMALRPILSAEDFIQYYGRCILKAEALKVRALRAAPAHPMTVELVSVADIRTVRALNGPVSVRAAGDLVTVSVLAYPETVYLP